MSRFQTTRRKSSTSNPRAASSTNPPILAYRTENHTVAYASAPIDPLTSPQFPTQTAESTYDSDNEPLIPSSAHELVPDKDLSKDEIQRFTATGRPMPAFKPSPLSSMATDMYSLPQLLPQRYTDDSVIPAIICNVIPGCGTIDEEEERRESIISATTPDKKRGFLGKLRRKSSADVPKGGKRITKVVYMPRREYIKYFARDLKGDYVGTEPFRRWNEGELEDMFGMYKPAPKAKGYKAPT